MQGLPRTGKSSIINSLKVREKYKSILKIIKKGGAIERSNTYTPSRALINVHNYYIGHIFLSITFLFLNRQVFR